MKTTVCLPRDLGAAELDRWREICAVNSDLDNPFLSPAFTLAVGRARSEARVAVVEDGGRIVAFFPFERRRFGLGVPIGAGLSDCQAIVCEPDADLDVHELIARCGLATWRFDHLVGAERLMVEPAATQCSSPIIELSGSFSAYLASGDRRARMTFQKERKLAREIGPVRYGFGVSDDEALDKLMIWKSDQYRRTGRPDRFGRKSTVAIVRDLAATALPELTGTLIALHAGDRLVAVEFSLRSSTTIAGWFNSHDCDLARYSPGSIRTLRTIEAAGLAGYRLYDLGKGDEEYKQRLKTGDLCVCEGWVVRPMPLAYARRAMSVPRERILSFVLRHRRLRLASRASLERCGSARVAVQRRRRTPSGPD